MNQKYWREEESTLLHLRIREVEGGKEKKKVMLIPSDILSPELWMTFQKIAKQKKKKSLAKQMCAYSTFFFLRLLSHLSRVADDGGSEELPGGGGHRAGQADGGGDLVEALEGPVVHRDGGGVHEGLGRLRDHPHQTRHLEVLSLSSFDSTAAAAFPKSAAVKIHKHLFDTFSTVALCTVCSVCSTRFFPGTLTFDLLAVRRPLSD